MKTVAHRLLASMVAGGLLSASTLVGAVDFSVQPRAEAGLLYYNFKQTSGTVAVPGGGNQAFGEFEWKDTLPYLGLGATLFVDRFFLDVSGQRAFSGEADDSQTNSFFVASNPGAQGLPTFQTLTRDDDVDFTRDEYALSAGYAITDRLAVFGGYKWAETEFESDFNGNTRIDVLTPTPVPFLFSVSGKLNYDVKQRGPFLGVTYGWDIKQGVLDGVLSANVAVAFLDSEIKQRLSNQVIVPTSPPGERARLADSRGSFDGDSVGLTFGVNWRGFTAVQGLTYLVGIQGYSYNFDSDDAAGEFTETAVNFRVGAAYSF